jgi:hypothetical protein
MEGPGEGAAPYRLTLRLASRGVPTPVALERGAIEYTETQRKRIANIALQLEVTSF